MRGWIVLLKIMFGLFVMVLNFDFYFNIVNLINDLIVDVVGIC